MGHVIRAQSSLPQMQIKLNVFPVCAVFVKNYWQMDSVLNVKTIHGSTVMVNLVCQISVVLNRFLKLMVHVLIASQDTKELTLGNAG